MRATRECPSEEELTDALTSAARTAIGALYRDNPDHRFYYIALITPAEAYGPALSAWSQEALAERSGTVEFRYNYADSPFDVVYEEFMAPVRELFAARPHWYSVEMSDGEIERERDLRLRVMENALRKLDREGLFGAGEARANMLVVVDVVLADPENVDRARRLNPPGPALDDFVRWYAGE